MNEHNIDCNPKAAALLTPLLSRVTLCQHEPVGSIMWRSSSEAWDVVERANDIVSWMMANAAGKDLDVSVSDAVEAHGLLVAMFGELASGGDAVMVGAEVVEV